jgi:hypothetical protein
LWELNVELFVMMSFSGFTFYSWPILKEKTHRIAKKKESLTHFLQNRPSQTKVLNFLFLALRYVLTNVSQNCNDT